MPTIDYSGDIAVTGSGAASNNVSLSVSGTLGVNLAATLDGSGNGSADETVGGILNFAYTYPGGSTSGTIPFDFSGTNLTFQTGSFTGSETIPISLAGIAGVPSVDFGITLTGSVDSDQNSISENIQAAASGNHYGNTFSVNLSASGSLSVGYVPELIGGTIANQTTDDKSALTPFASVIVTDPNAGQTDTATVTLSAPENGTLSSLAGGAYNAATGIYSVSGTVDAVMTALNGLTFTPTSDQTAPGTTVATNFALEITDTADESVTDSNTSVVTTETGVTTLANIDAGNGVGPEGGVIMDSAGNLFGTSAGGGGSGLVFEILKTANGYASTPTILASFNFSQGAFPVAGLITDSAGDLFGTTQEGGTDGDGAVFEIAKTANGYASTPTTLVTFNGTNGLYPMAGLVADAAGNLFGTTWQGGASHDGTVFEVAKTPDGYASTPTILVTFDGTDPMVLDGGNGAYPMAGLIVDSAGNLFGTTSGGGANFDGTVFEIAKTTDGYATTPTTLVTFDGADGVGPFAGLITDAAGDLFGTTSAGGVNNDGTVFEIAKTADGYATTPTILHSFNGTDGQGPTDNLIMDAAGDLFGVAYGADQNGDKGTAFEIVKTASGYAANAVILAEFNGMDGEAPRGGLIANAAGNLFGTTALGGPAGGGTVFELAGSDFRSHAVSTDFNIDGMSDILWQNDSGQAAIWTMNGFTQLDGQPVGGDPGSNWKVVGTGDFNGDGMADILWQDTDNGQVVVWTMNGFNQTSSTFVGGAPGSDWKMVTTGDFAGNGQTDLVFQNTDGQAVLWTMSGTSQTTSTFVGGDPGSQWHIVGTGDFNADGKSDIVWQDSDNGQVVVWTMDGTNQTGSFFVGNAPGSDWKVAGVGDFAGDGQSDLLFQNTTTGQAVIWTMDGTTQTTSTFVGGSPGPTWHIEGTGDYNGDGKADILWQNDNGQAAIWTMNGATQLAGSPVGGNPGTSWHIPAGVG